MDKIWRPFAHLDDSKPQPDIKRSPEPLQNWHYHPMPQLDHGFLQPSNLFYGYPSPQYYDQSKISPQAVTPRQHYYRGAIYQDETSNDCSSVTSSRPPSANSLGVSVAGSLTDSDSQCSWDGDRPSHHSTTSSLGIVDSNQGWSAVDYYGRMIPESHHLYLQHYQASSPRQTHPGQKRQISLDDQDDSPPPKRSKSTKPKPFQCHSCPISFLHKSSLTKHLRTHSGFKPFVCPVCSRSFSQSGNMLRHLRTVHKTKV